MRNNTIQVAAPSPTTTTDFSVSIPSGAGITVAVNARDVVTLNCFWQGPTAGTYITKNLTYQPVPFTWDDVTGGLNFLAFVNLTTGVYALLERYQ